jgi:hypothetical protein
VGEESLKPVSTPTGAVFLSYASQDAAAAQRICAALRLAGVEVWFDQSELRGGERLGSVDPQADQDLCLVHAGGDHTARRSYVTQRTASRHRLHEAAQDELRKNASAIRRAAAALDVFA